MGVSDKKSGSDLMLKLVLSGIFIVYILVLFKIILFKYMSPADVFTNIINGELSGFRSFNIKPFQTFGDFMDIARRGQFLRGFSNILGNMLVFMPMGYFIPMLFRRLRKPAAVILTAVLLSVFFEISQYLFYLGTSDIDDVILNTLGGAAGHGCFCGMSRFIKCKRILYIITIILSGICLAGAFIVALNEFGYILGINNYEVRYEGKENIPEEKSDYEGTFLRIDAEKIYFYSSYVTEQGAEKDFVPIINLNVSERTKYILQETEEDKKDIVINYRVLSKKEAEQIQPYFGVSIWNNGEEASTVVFKQMQSGDGQMIQTSGDSKSDNNISDSGRINLWGNIDEITINGFVLNMGTTEELENGGSIAQVGIGENAVYVNVRLQSDTIYKKKIVHDAIGKNVENMSSSRDELKTDMTVSIKGYKDNDIFVAEEVEISIFTFMNK